MAAKRRKPKRDRKIIREEALRPYKGLGYDYYQLAGFLSGREAYGIVEKLLKRAIWLNPFEPRFKESLAVCFFQQKQYQAAGEWAEQAVAQSAECKMAQSLLDRIRAMKPEE